ncbi:MAG: Polysaccharide biosynthesis protein, partial [Candidatus Collierbacteria bacterium GW2011_GWC2_45_15]
LEREIKFNKLILPQILETLAFNGIAVFAAWKGLGINAFSFAVLGRGVVGLVAMYIVFPWVPVIGIYKNSLKSLLKFGLPYQANTFLAVLKDDGMTIILTKIIGTQGLGYLGWASKWAGLPLRILMDNLTKVSFPAFARLQHDEVKLGRAVELNLKYLSLASLPILIGMGFIAYPMTGIIPRYAKWIPAIIPLYIYLYNSAWASISTSLTNLLNATGRIKTTFKLMMMWTGLTWLLFPIMAIKYGYLGVSYSIGIIATTSVITVILAKKAVAFSLIKALRTPLIASTLLLAFLVLLRGSLNSIEGIIVVSVLSAILYALACFLLEGKQLIEEGLSLFKARHA